MLKENKVTVEKKEETVCRTAFLDHQAVNHAAQGFVSLDIYCPGGLLTTASPSDVRFILIMTFMTLSE